MMVTGINRDDADLDGDGVPEVIAELLEGKRNSLLLLRKNRQKSSQAS